VYPGTITPGQSPRIRVEAVSCCLSASFSGTQIFTRLNPFALLTAFCCAGSSTLPFGVFRYHPQAFF
jgi:hypothetical protein